jgi:plasmid stabilization system protein ParE
MAEAVAWYLERGRGLASDFLEVLDATVARVEDNPFQYQEVHKGIRKALMPRFPYSILFRVTDDEIVILACFHARRDPRRWQSRR